MTQRLANQPSSWLPPVVMVGALLLVFALTATRDAVSVDAHAASVQSWRIASTGSPWLEEISESPEISQDFFIGEAANGHVVASRMAGPVLLSIPFYAALHRNPDPEEFSLVPAGLAAATLTTLTALLLFLSVRRRVPEPVAVVGSLAFALATPTWSVSADAAWTHTLTQLGIAGAAFAADRGRWWLSGTFLALGMLGRPHLALVAAVLGVGVALSRRSWAPMVRIAVPTVLALGVLGLWNSWMFGSLSVGGAYAGRGETVAAGQDSQLLNYLGFVVSLDRGLLIWTPVVLTLLPALLRQWSGLPDWSRWLLVGGAVYSIAQMRLNHFAGGDAFYGYRHALELITCAAPALMLCWEGVARPLRFVVVGVLALQFAAISLGAITESFLLPLEDAWGRNSFAAAFGQQPLAVGLWAMICVAAALMGYRRWADAPKPVDAGYGRTVRLTEE